MPRRALLIILLAVLCLRLAGLAAVYPEHPERVVTADAQAYDKSAQAFLQLGAFAKSPQEPTRPQTLRTPGYSVFMALCYALFGVHHLPVLLAQMVFSLLTLGLTYLIAARLWDQATGLLAAALAGLDPNSFLFSQVLQTETLFTALLMLAVWAGLMLGWAKAASKPWALAFGLALALATLVRPISYYLVWPLLGWLIIHALRQGYPRRGLVPLVLAVLLPWAVLVGGWQVRNLHVSGSAQFSHLQALLLLDYQAAYVTARAEGISVDQARANLRAQAEQGLDPDLPEGRRYQAYQGLALKVLKAHPGLAAREVLLGLGKVLLSPLDPTLFDFYGGNSSESGSLGDLARLTLRDYLTKWTSPPFRGYLLVNVLALLYLFVLYGGVARAAGPALFREREQLFAHVFLWLALAYLLVTPAGPGGSARFRIPAQPLLALYAAHGLRLLWARRRA